MVKRHRLFKKERVKKMTPKEKLKRLTNPQCAEDYGLSISFDELASFDTGRAFLEAFNEIYVPFDKQGIINDVLKRGKA